ncbi:MAG: c-type cytochrome [Pseudoxanthomonas sp.]
MRHALVWGLAGLAVTATLGAVAFAQTSVEPLPDNTPVQSAPLEIDLTKTVAGDAQAGQAKAAACAACHGADGNSVVPMYPRIAGQSEAYIAEQMALIASGQRNEGAVVAMLPFVQDLTPQDMRDIGAYFATQKGGAGLADDGVVADGPYKDMKFYEIGQKLYRGGDPARGIPACMACHGPSGGGIPGLAPHVGGQHQEYVASRLQFYQSVAPGTVVTPKPAMMVQVAKALTAEEITALSTYLQGLHNHADDVAAASTAKPAAH